MTKNEELVPVMQKASKWLLAEPGRTVKEALTKFGLEGTYSKFWLLHRRAELAAEGWTFKEPTKAIVKQMRDDKNYSWGEIAARHGDGPFGTPEGRIRRMYTEATGKHHEGTRIGHGGRFLGGVDYAEALYRGQTKEGQPRMQVGTSAEVNAKWEQVVAAILAEREAERKLSRAGTRAEKAQAHTDLAKKKAATKQAVKAHADAEKQAEAPKQAAAKQAAPKRKPRKLATPQASAAA